MESPHSQFDIEQSNPHPETLSALETLRLGAVHAYYSVSRALRFDKVASLLQRAELSIDLPVSLLGKTYTPATQPTETAAREVLSHLVHHFHSTPWMTYRSDFTPLAIGENKTFLKTDAGWGCTLRSIQMIAAQTMIRHVLGPDWRWPLLETATPQQPQTAQSEPNLITAPPPAPPEELLEVLRLFWDVPDTTSPFSLHNMCYHGAECGVFPGRWLGPSTGCRALESAASAASSEQLKGLKIAVLGGTGGGAPVLGTDRFLSFFSGNNNSHDANGSNGKDNIGLLLLVPLVIGIGKLNPVYYPQLQAVLALPQSVGIVGGSPGASFYVVGCQGESLLYLDPHTIQPAACSDADWVTCSCDVLRTLWLSSLDPSLALGFYCKNKEDYIDLCVRLKELEEENRGVPLVCVREGMGDLVGEAGNGGDGGEPQEWEEDDIEEESSNDGSQNEEIEKIDERDAEETQDSGFNEVEEGGGSVPAVEEEEEVVVEQEEEEMQRQLSELCQQSSTKSVWEFV